MRRTGAVLDTSGPCGAGAAAYRALRSGRHDPCWLPRQLPVCPQVPPVWKVKTASVPLVRSILLRETRDGTIRERTSTRYSRTSRKDESRTSRCSRRFARLAPVSALARPTGSGSRGLESAQGDDAPTGVGQESRSKSRARLPARAISRSRWRSEDIWYRLASKSQVALRWCSSRSI